MQPLDGYGYFFIEPNQPFERRALRITEIQPDEVVVKVAGCGLCRTDIGFWRGAVRTKTKGPLVLGHEISGEVMDTGNLVTKLSGMKVIVPAVLPCGECELCQSGRDNICQNQKMPGNDFNGGFATHVVVPGRSLVVLPKDLRGYALSQLSVIADAATTPYAAMLKSQIKAGELGIVIGVGGIGTYMVQHAKNAGATVLAVDVDENRLQTARTQGADYSLLSAVGREQELKNKIRDLVREQGLKRFGWKVFETSGSASGQQLAFSLLSFAGTLSVVGFTMEKLSIRLSNVMAYDATIVGNWGCSPSHYGEVVRQVLDGKVRLKENIQEYPLDQINELAGLALNNRLEKRAILRP